jgi:hypothetical protein
VRKLCEKFSIEGEEIIKTANGEPIPHDEPVFIMRARDRLAQKLLTAYRLMSLEDGCNEYHFQKLDRTISAFTRFREEHPERMKQPSITRGK